MLSIRTGRIEFAADTGSRTNTVMVWFPTQTIRECWVGMGGYSVGYSSGDHELKTVEAALRCGVVSTEFGPGVQVAATLHLRDKNGDDSFQGWVDYVLFAELDPLPIFDPEVLDVRLEVR